jgi:hypothetical protein
MTTHTISIDVRYGYLIVTCDCCRWQRQERLCNVEQPFELLRQLEDEHQRHAAADLGATPPPQPQHATS